MLDVARPARGRVQRAWRSRLAVAVLDEREPVERARELEHVLRALWGALVERLGQDVDRALLAGRRGGETNMMSCSALVSTNMDAVKSARRSSHRPHPLRPMIFFSIGPSMMRSDTGGISLSCSSSCATPDYKSADRLCFAQEKSWGEGKDTDL